MTRPTTGMHHSRSPIGPGPKFYAAGVCGYAGPSPSECLIDDDDDDHIWNPNGHGAKTIQGQSIDAQQQDIKNFKNKRPKL